MDKITLPVPETVIRHHGKTLFAPMREWLSRKALPPVLLLTGPSGVGKRDIGYFLAQWILCENSGFHEQTADLFGGGDAQTPTISGSSEPLPCGQCPSCLRAVSGSWVDFTEILPEEDDGTLKIEQFRKLKATQGFGAHEGSYKMILIPNADRMTPQAANSVLKLLEEPPKGWIFFLTASDPTLLLPTITSRCQTLRLKPFSSEELKTLLSSSGGDSTRQQICAELAQGSWGKAKALASEEVWEKRGLVFEFIKNPIAGLNPLVEWAAQEPRHFDIVVDQLEIVTSEFVRWSLSSQQPENYPWINRDAKTILGNHAQSVSQALGSPTAARSFWLARAERLASARQQSLAPLNRKLLIQDLLFPWIDIKHKES